MQVFIALFALVAVTQAGFVSIASPTVLARTPALDSAVIKSDRLGGNFAYSVSENHAYAATHPVIQHVAQPVVSYNAPLTYAAAPFHPYAAAPLTYTAHHPLSYTYAQYAHTPFAFSQFAPTLAFAQPAVAAVVPAAPAPAPEAPVVADTVAIEA